MADCLPQTLVDAAQDFCCVTSDPYWMAKLNLLRTLAGLDGSTAQEIITLAKCQIAQWGTLRGLEMYMLCVANGG